MSETRFADNYRDMSEEQGARAGFQFEFYCERCNMTWQSDFVPFKSGQAAAWMDKASGFLGGVLGGVGTAIGSAGDAVAGVGEATYGTERDKAFKAALDEAMANFHRCPKCVQYVCDQCWNTEAGLCRQCAPSAEVEAEAAFAAGKAQAAGEKGALEGIHEGKHMDVKTRRQLVCPDCGAETQGAKFCPECGKKLASSAFCTECGAGVPAEAKFCPECGMAKAPPATP
jgi:hypothetical protein